MQIQETIAVNDDRDMVDMTCVQQEDVGGGDDGRTC